MSNQKYNFDVNQVRKINRMLPKGYKFITTDEYRKKQTQSKKKSKIVYVPVEEPNRSAVSRRKVQPISYDERDGTEHIKNVYYDSQKVEAKQQPAYENREKIRSKLQQAPIIFPVVEPIIQSKALLTPLEIIQRIKSHQKFIVILQFRDQLCLSNYERIISKAESPSYNIYELQSDFQKIFMTIYENYNRSLPIYNDAAQLQNYINNLINVQKTKIKQSQKQQIAFEDISIVGGGLSSRIPSALNKKKTVIAKPQVKNITIMDKRVLGQNIKKLPSQYLPQICKIVFETIETREQYVIDIDTLPLKKVKELQIYVADCIQKLDGFIDQQLKNDQDSSQSSFVITDDFD